MVSRHSDYYRTTGIDKAKTMQPYELLDRDCPGALALLEAAEAEVAAEGLKGEEAFLVTLAS